MNWQRISLIFLLAVVFFSLFKMVSKPKQASPEDLVAAAPLIPVHKPGSAAPLFALPTPDPIQKRVPMPKVEKRDWAKNEYTIPQRTRQGILAVQRNDQYLYSLVSQINVAKCKNGIDYCVRFSNGQTVVANQQLMKHLPPGLIELASSPEYHRSRQGIGKRKPK